MNTLRLALAGLLLAGTLGTEHAVGAANWRPLDEPRAVIILLPAGCPPGLPALARACRGGPLALDAIVAGAVRTGLAGGEVADSAAAASAIATGARVPVGALSMQPERGPLPTLLEAARLSGRSVGLVTSGRITDPATAAFAAHAPAGAPAGDVLRQLVQQELDVVFGGGADALTADPEEGENARESLRARGVKWVESREALQTLAAGPAWGLFAPGALAPALERGLAATGEPTLQEMTVRALTLLDRNPRGFLLVVAAGGIEPACRANDPAGAVGEFLAFDAAASEVIRYAVDEGRGRTLIVGCPGHDTGGLAPGRNLAETVNALARMRLTAASIESRLGADTSAGNVDGHLFAWWDVRLTPAESASIQSLLADGLSPAQAIGEVVSRTHAGVGWTTHGRTAADVPLWSLGPGRPEGLVDLPTLGRQVARAMGADLEALKRERFAKPAPAD